MNTKLKRLIPLFFSAMLGVLMMMPVLSKNVDMQAVQQSYNGLTSSESYTGFGGVYDTNIIHRYESASVGKITQNNATFSASKPSCESIVANITMGAIQFNNYTLIGENDNIRYQDLVLSSFSASSSALRALFYPLNNTEYMQLPFTVNISFMDTDYYTPIPQGYIVNYLSPAGSGQVATDQFGTAKIQLSGSGLNPGNYSMIVTLMESLSGPILSELNYTFKIIKIYQNLYEPGKCKLHIRALDFNLVSLKSGLNYNNEFLTFEKNRSWAEITVHFDKVQPGMFNSNDGLFINGNVMIGTADSPTNRSFRLNIYVKYENILPWGDQHNLYQTKPFSVTFLYYFSEIDFKTYDYLITQFSGFCTMHWQYLINTQAVNIDLPEYFIYRIDSAELYGWSWIRAHQELFMLIGFLVIGLVVFLGYRPYLKWHINRQLKREQEYLYKLLKLGLEPTFEAYLAEQTVVPKQAKLAKLERRDDPEPPIPDLEDQLINAHPSEKRRFYIKGAYDLKQIKKRGIITGLFFFVFSFMIVNGLAIMVEDTKFLLPTSVPLLNAIVLLAIYSFLFMICIRLGIWASKPPKVSVRKFSEHILNVQKQMIDRQLDSDKPKDLFSAELMESVERILKEAEDEDRVKLAKKSKTPRFDPDTGEELDEDIKENRIHKSKISLNQYDMIIGWSVAVGMIIPMFFLAKMDLFLSSTTEINLLLFLVIGIIIAVFGYLALVKLPNQKQLKMLANHKVIRAIHQRKISYFFVVFLCFIVLEEIIFRYYLTGIFLLEHLNQVDAILLSAGIFAAFHSLQYLQFPSVRLVTIWIVIALALGIYLGFLFVECGWITSLIAHFCISTAIYILIFKQIRHNSK